MKELHQKIILCDQCPRLVEYRSTVNGTRQPRKWRGTSYWGKPVPGFGDPEAEILIVGLAPGFHGANRTGRPFTGDGAGILLYKTLYKMGWGSIPDVTSKDDGLVLKHVYISNIVKCVPPKNIPTGQEKENCAPYLFRELSLLKNVKTILALGAVAHNEILRYLKKKKIISSLKEYPFQHGAIYSFNSWHYSLANSYHPSTYNVNTGVLTENMFLDIFKELEKNHSLNNENN